MKVYNPEGNVLQRNPAEASTPVAMAAAGLICKAIGVEDVDTIIYVSVLVSFLPTAIKWVLSATK